MAATPTLLPSLKFHDLVFGNELGSGSFSTVKYARQIMRFDQPVPGETAAEVSTQTYISSFLFFKKIVFFFYSLHNLSSLPLN
jgi:hypothetical protein